MESKQILLGCDVFDGYRLNKRCGLVIDGGLIENIVSDNEVCNYPDYQIRELSGGLLAPGFVDLQVNGGGGKLFNNQPSLDTIKTICAAHVRLGVTSLLVTLISDSDELRGRAIKAGELAYKNSVVGFLGLHLEGPFLSREKPGVHKLEFIKKMSNDDLDELLRLKTKLNNLMLTVGVENVTEAQIEILARAGVVLSIGHSNSSYEKANLAFNSGVRAVTHLFNAMSLFNHRKPGLVGAAFNSKEVFASVIADGYHVKSAAIEIALRAKKKETGDRGDKITDEKAISVDGYKDSKLGKIFLISDAMATVGSDEKSFKLYGDDIYLKGNRLQTEGGVLAGAHLDLATAVGFMVGEVGIELCEALRMASLYPAQCLRRDDVIGQFGRGSWADIVQIDEDLQVRNVWVRGKMLAR